MMCVQSGKMYRHFKGDYYVVVGEAANTETYERMVVYHPLQNPDILYVRPIDQFFERIKSHAYGDQKYRFVPVTAEEVLKECSN